MILGHVEIKKMQSVEIWNSKLVLKEREKEKERERK